MESETEKKEIANQNAEETAHTPTNDQDHPKENTNSTFVDQESETKPSDASETTVPVDNDPEEKKSETLDEEIIVRRERAKTLFRSIQRQDSSLALGLSEPVTKIILTIPPPSNEQFKYEFPIKWTVDQVKFTIWRITPPLKNFNIFDHVLGVSEDAKLLIEFVRFSQSHPLIKKAVENDMYVHLQVYSLRAPPAKKARKQVQSLQVKDVKIMRQSLSELAASELPASDTKPKSPQLDRDSNHNEPKPELKKPTNTENKAKEPQTDKLEEKIDSIQPATNQSSQTKQGAITEKTATVKMEDKQPETNQPKPTSSEIKLALEPTPPEVKPVVSEPTSPEVKPSSESTPEVKPRSESTPSEVKPVPESTSPEVKSAAQKEDISKLDPNPSSVHSRPNKSWRTATAQQTTRRATVRLLRALNDSPRNGEQNQEQANQEGAISAAPIDMSKPLITPKPGFTVITPTNENNTADTPMAQATEIIDTDKDPNYYQETFFETAHANWIVESDTTPMILSIMKPKVGPSYPAIVWSAEGLEKISIPVAETKTRTFHSQPTMREKLIVLKSLKPNFPFKQLKRVEDDIDFPSELCNLEISQKVQSYKFGIVYAKEGQTDENDMFGNETSPVYEEFLSALGQKIELKGWTNYRGGLDVKNDTTGKYSVYTNYLNFEIMFHVSTLLPFYPADKQQLERKRHIGNDIVVIIFMDGTTPYSPTTIASEFNHVFIVIQPVKLSGEIGYRIEIACKEGVPLFGPPLKPIYKSKAELRDFLLLKLINAERASYYAPAFAHKISRTRKALIQAIVRKYGPQATSVSGL